MPRKGMLVLGAIVALGAIVMGVEMGRTRTRAIAAAAAETSETIRAATQTAPARVAPGAQPQRVFAYYFHTTDRCVSCRTIEAYSQEALERAFADAIRSGRIVWLPGNVEVPGNEHFIDDFRLYSKSLVLVREADGALREWKNFEQVWQLVQDKPRFVRYVQEEMRRDLSTAS